MDPENSYVYQEIGCTLIDCQKYHEAEKYFSKALSINPLIKYSRCGMGRAMRIQKRFAQARTILQDSIRLFPEDDRSHLELGLLHLDEEHLDEARKEFLLAMKLNPHYAAPHIGLGCLYLKQSQYSMAEKEFTAARKLEPGDGRAILFLTFAYLKEEKTRMARRTLEELLEQKFSWKRIRQELALFYPESCWKKETYQQLRWLCDKSEKKLKKKKYTPLDKTGQNKLLFRL